MQRNKLFLTLAFSMLLGCNSLNAQEKVVDVRYVEPQRDTIVEYRSNSLRYSLGTNLYDWANLGTMSMEGSIAVMRHFTINAGVRYNPWSFGADDNPRALQNRRRTVYLGPRFYPWNVYSGFWFSVRAQYEEYNRGGLFGNPLTEEGDAFGISAGLGYSHMLHKNWNLDLGLFGWGGKCYYTEYASPRCGTCVLESGVKPFFRWDAAFVSIVYVFNANK